MLKIKKAIVPIAGLGTRFLPLSKAVPKELWPLVDKPVIQYILEEAIASGMKEIIFVTRTKKSISLDYFKTLLKSKKISFSRAYQTKQLGDGHAVLQAEKLIRKEPCAVLFADDIAESKSPVLWQLIKLFNKYQKPVIALYKLPKERLPFYGVVKVEKINKTVYKIKDIIEKPPTKEAPSNLAVVGKYVISPEVFHFLKISPRAKGEIRLAGAFKEMLRRGETIYGYEIKGKWLECGNKLSYLKSNFYLSLKHPQFKKELKKFLKEEKL